MIWTKSGIVEDHQLSISVLDRTFEHGLGLFETMRTWNGRAPLLNRHLQRLKNSAEALDLPLDPASLPNQNDIQALVNASGITGDARLRLVASGGVPGGCPSSVWVRCWPIEPFEWTKLRVSYLMWNSYSRLDGHKTLNSWDRNISWELARERGDDEALIMSVYQLDRPPSFVPGQHYLWEGTRTNLFAIRTAPDQGPVLITPSTEHGKLFLPGIMRQLVLDRARDAGLPVSETSLTFDEVKTADEVFLTNAVRGIMPVADLHRRTIDAPGPVTKRLWEDHVLPWLEHGGDAPS
jgi:branched-subunit amino acid aminotransferase/4-amino-4-deoxychorismate lyase